MIDRIRIHDGGAWSLLVRHARRQEITSESLFLAAQLTDQGREDARDLGRRLAELPLHQVVTSPVQRCVDTGANILVGMGLDLREAMDAVVQEPVLFDAYVDDPVALKQTFSRGTPEDRIMEYLGGNVLPGLRTIDHGSRVLTDLIRSRMVGGKLTVLVSHDALLMPFLLHHCGRRFDRSRWLGFLDGAVLCVRDGRLHVDG